MKDQYYKCPYCGMIHMIRMTQNTETVPAIGGTKICSRCRREGIISFIQNIYVGKVKKIKKGSD